eukprot:806304-Heterocapsa_arctica.AAC.1
MKRTNKDLPGFRSNALQPQAHGPTVAHGDPWEMFAHACLTLLIRLRQVRTSLVANGGIRNSASNTYTF